MRTFHTAFLQSKLDALPVGNNGEQRVETAAVYCDARENGTEVSIEVEIDVGLAVCIALSNFKCESAPGRVLQVVVRKCRSERLLPILFQLIISQSE